MMNLSPFDGDIDISTESGRKLFRKVTTGTKKKYSLAKNEATYLLNDIKDARACFCLGQFDCDVTNWIYCGA